VSSDPRKSFEPGVAGQWLKGNLVGLGSAAVLAVYAAGFERTRAAAAKFSEADISRRPVPPMRTTGEVGALVPRTPDTAKTPTPVVVAKPVPHVAAGPSSPANSNPRVVDSAPAPEKHADSAVSATPVPAPTPQAAIPHDSTPAPAPVKTTTAVDVPAAPKPAPAPADTAQSEKEIVRKDGTYSGWGTSRHGDIQATIQIKDGKIVFAAISECLTQYSCSWIAALPPQVLARQSADVDIVSGATQSTNAFYYAVLQALNKAK
jgi:uncharacterized protein with FMN-binding domain